MMSATMGNRKGIALLTVLVVLTLLVILATAFIQVVRTEIRSTENFKNAIIVQDVAKTGIESLREEFSSLVNGNDGLAFTGDEIRPYVSLLDSWAFGKAGVVDEAGPRTVYDLRAWLYNRPLDLQLRTDGRFPVVIHNGSVWEMGSRINPSGRLDNFSDVRLRLFAKRGVDEDPGDPTMDLPSDDFNRDEAPGLANVDDDFDGIVDADPLLPLSQQKSVEDDDEDGLKDEDGIDLRRLVLGEVLGDARVDNINFSIDADGDFAGIDPSAGRINVAIAGNRNAVGPGVRPPAPSAFPLHRYHQGLHPSELDLETFCSLMLGIGPGVTLAQRLIEFREGNDRGVGRSSVDEFTVRPFDGAQIGNENFNILFRTPPSKITNDVPGDLFDSDDDGLTDEEDEIYAGPTDFINGIPGDLLDNRGNNRDQNNRLLISNGVDDVGVGIPNVVDDIYEIDAVGDGVDDPPETRPRNPWGDDSPPLTRLSVLEIEGMNTALPGSSFTPFQLLDRYITVQSTSNRHRQNTRQDLANNRNKINPNLILSQTPLRSRQPLTYLYPLIGLDNDGDWGTDLRDPTVQDFDFAPIIRDDKNGNQIPDGDWDTGAEITSGPKANSIDDDYDGVVDDTGDANRDGIASYDPEGHVDEDPVTFDTVTDSDRDRMVADINGSNTFQGGPVLPLFRQDGRPADRVDNNSNRTRWMSDGIDNDGDGFTDESFLDEIRSETVLPEDALDEGVDEPGEFYILSWDKEAIDGVDNNENSDDFFDLDGNGIPSVGDEGVDALGRVFADGLDNDGDGSIDEFIDEPEEIIRTLERVGNRLLFKHDEDPMDIQFVANLADSLDFSISLQLNDGASKVEIRDASARTIAQAWGNEAIRITEVMARPVIRLQPESLGSDSQGDWDLMDDAPDDDSDGLHFVTNLDSQGGSSATSGTWSFPDIPPGNYWIALHAFFKQSSGGRRFHLNGVRAEVETTDLLIHDLSIPEALDAATNIFFPTPLFRNAFLNPTRPKTLISTRAVPVDDSLEITLTQTDSDQSNLSFDYIELYAPLAQYIELCNFGERPIDLAGWEIRSGTGRIARIDPDADDTILLPGQFAVIYPVEDEDALDPGPSGLQALEPTQYPGWDNSAGPLVLTREDMVDSATGSDPFQLTGSLEEIVFASDEASLVELWAPYDTSPVIGDVTHVIVDSFYYNGSSDFCSPVETFKRQDTLGFAPQHRGDPTRSILSQEAGVVIADETFTVDRYVHGPMRYLAEDAVVTVWSPDEEPTSLSEAGPQKIANSSVYKPQAIVGRSTVASATLASTRTEYGEILFDLSETMRERIAPDFGFSDVDFPSITFHWPGILNHFRDPEADLSGTDQGLPVLYIRAGGVSERPIGMIDLDPTENGDNGEGQNERLAFHGDLLYVIDPTGKSLDDLEQEYADILDVDTNSIRITIRVRNSDVEEGDPPFGVSFPDSMFAYIEISPGLPSGNTRIAGDPGREHFYYPDLPLPEAITDLDGRFFYMERRRCVDPNDECDPFSIPRYHRSLRFREGRMANCAPYMTGANGRNMEKYSMGRGVFSGPTPREMAQIATRMEFHSDPVVDGLLNVNVADQKVLFALPFFPPDSEDFIDISKRLRLNALMSQVLVMGRSQRGFDGEIGNIGFDDDRDGFADLADLGYVDSSFNPLSDRFTPSWDANLGAPQRDESLDNGFGEFGVDDNRSGVADDPSEFKSPGSDDGPYTAVGDVTVPLLHPLVIERLRFRHDPNLDLDLKPLGWREFIAEESFRPLIDETDIHIMLGRIMNLITIQANEFTVISRARVIDSDSREILAEQKREENLAR